MKKHKNLLVVLLAVMLAFAASLEVSAATATPTKESARQLYSKYDLQVYDNQKQAVSFGSVIHAGVYECQVFYAADGYVIGAFIGGYPEIPWQQQIDNFNVYRGISTVKGYFPNAIRTPEDCGIQIHPDVPATPGLNDAAYEAAANYTGPAYKYVLPKTVPQHDYYKEAFSTSHEFRDIFISQFGNDKAFIYDMIVHVMLDVLYNDTYEYGKDIEIIGFQKIANAEEMNAARLAIQEDMPFLGTFVLFGAGGSGRNYECMASREIANYFSDNVPKNSKSYVSTRDSVMSELNKYRSAVAGITNDEEKLNVAGKMFDADSVYDLNAPYHAVSALLSKRGICGSSNWAFSLVGNAIEVPSYYLHVADRNHASTLVKPNGGELKVIDVTFGQRSPKVQSISSWKDRDNVTWTPRGAFGFMNEYYYPDVDIFGHLGGLS